MRIILKLLAAPFVLALTLLVAVLNFAFSFGRRCAHGYNLYPALQGGGWERRCPDNGGTL